MPIHLILERLFTAATPCNTLQHPATHCNIHLTLERLFTAKVHCSVLQCVAVCCRVCCSDDTSDFGEIVCSKRVRRNRGKNFARYALCCSVLHSECVAVCCSVLQSETSRGTRCVAVCCRVSALQCVAVCCRVSALQCVAVCCRVKLRAVRASQKSAFLSIDSSCPQKSVLLSCPFVEENMFSSLENTFSKVSCRQLIVHVLGAIVVSVR